MRDYFNIKINLPGGIASPGYLKDIFTAASEAQVRYVRFGGRQQLLMTVHYEQMRFIEKDLTNLRVAYEVNSERLPNIISSYCGEEVFRTGQWLSSSEYHTVLDSFDFSPRLKVNISDSNQSFTPFFTGNLNFVSSKDPHFWYLYIRPKQSNHLFRWRHLIYTNEIGRVARKVEDLLLIQNDTNEEKLYTALSSEVSYISLPVTQELELPSFSLPYYEGFNRYEARTWLGLYRRDEQFPIDFLLEMCNLCLKTRIGEICTTPWKSLIIKGIEDQYRNEWSHILGRHNINVRHAASELAWQTEDQTDEGTLLKKYLIRFIEKNDTRTFGLCFGIQTQAKSEVFGSVLIRKRPLIRLGQLAFFSLYDIYYTENFNPNSRTNIPFEIGLFKIHVAGQLERLCRRYNNRRISENANSIKTDADDLLNQQLSEHPAHQCPHCFTVYDQRYGDLPANIPPGIPFDVLPDSYVCPTCDASKHEFKRVLLTESVILSN
jgi:rubredoxin